MKARNLHPAPGATNKEIKYYVAIGASAGGLEAIETFFLNLPPDTGMGFIVIQHLSPDYKSLMVELLSKRTPMTVCRAEDGMPVLPNQVYLIPPKKVLTIFHGKLLLTDQEHTRGPNLPIDIFLNPWPKIRAKRRLLWYCRGPAATEHEESVPSRNMVAW